MDSNSISPSGRPQRSGKKRSLKGAEMDHFQESERASKHQSISPGDNASSAAAAAAAARPSFLPSSPSEQGTTDIPTFSNLPSPVIPLPILSRRPPTPPKSRKASLKTAKAASPKGIKATPPKPPKATSSPPPPTFTCDECLRPYTIPLTIDIDPHSRPMQTLLHPRLAPNRITGGLHGQWRHELVDANLRYEAYDSNQGCPHIARQRLEYAQACEEWLVGADERYGAGVGSQENPVAIAASERDVESNVIADAAYHVELIAENERKTHLKLHEAYIKSHNEGCWERGANAAGLSVEDYLKPKKLNMRTCDNEGRIARAASKAEILSDLAQIGLSMPAKALVYDNRATKGYGDVECRDVGFYGLEGTPDYWGRMAGWESGVSA